MHKRTTLVDNISRNLSILTNEVEAKNSLNLQDINIHAEQFLKILLNKIFGYNLVDLNAENVNSIAIDLADSEKRIAIQVTSSCTKRKINETVSKFCDQQLNSRFSNLKILVLKTKVRQQGMIERDDFSFDITKDVWDISFLLRQIKNIDDISKIQEIDDWMRSELTTKKQSLYLKPTQEDFDNYFGKFLDNEIITTSLLFRAQPTVSDCREVFSDELFADIYQAYGMMHYMGSNDAGHIDSLRTKDTFKVISATYEEVKSGKHGLHGGIGMLYNLGALRPGKLTFYSISFIEEGAELGTSFKFWVFLNGRWVFFPKANFVVEGLQKFKKDKSLTRFIRILKFFGFDKAMIRNNENPIFLVSYIYKSLTNKKIVL